MRALLCGDSQLSRRTGTYIVPPTSSVRFDAVRLD